MLFPKNMSSVFWSVFRSIPICKRPRMSGAFLQCMLEVKATHHTTGASKILDDFMAGFMADICVHLYIYIILYVYIYICPLLGLPWLVIFTMFYNELFIINEIYIYTSHCVLFAYYKVHFQNGSPLRTELAKLQSAALSCTLPPLHRQGLGTREASETLRTDDSLALIMGWLGVGGTVVL